MPGRRDSNLRSGDSAEKTGLNLLGPLASMVHVPREEDFGIDAVGTVLVAEGRTLFAQASFMAQIKADSADPITYADGEIDWFFALQLPLYLVRVNQVEPSARIYSLTHASIACVPKRHMNMHRTLRFVPDMPTSPMRSREDGGLDVGLGDPILKVGWGLRNDKDELGRLRRLLLHWVQMEQETVNLRACGYFGTARWETNAMPVTTGPILATDIRPTPRMQETAARLTPMFHILKSQIERAGDPVERAAAQQVERYLLRTKGWSWMERK